MTSITRQQHWRRRRRDLVPRLRWVRDDERVHVVIPRHGHSIELRGAEALVFELWVEGGSLDRCLEFLRYSHGLTATQTWDLFSRLLGDIAERGGLPPLESGGDGDG